MTAQRKKMFRQKVGLQQLVIVGVLIILFTFFCLMSASFRKYTTLITMASYMYYIMLMAIGVTFVIITGGIDLSLGTTMMCAALIGGMAYNNWHWPMGWCLALVLAVATMIGLLNGVMVAYIHRHDSIIFDQQLKRDAI